MNRIAILTMALIVLPIWVWGQNELSSLEFFIDNDTESNPLEIKISSNFKNLTKTKNKPANQPASITFYFEDGDSTMVSAKIKPRGEFRRKYCHAPPIWLNFKSGDFKESSVEEYDKVKLVTHCRSQTASIQNLLQEYYIYKAYQILSPYSFRTRLVKIHYDDTGRDKDPETYYGFLIEDEDQMAARNDCVPVEMKIHAERTERQVTTVMDVFQFMIGNTDYSVPGLHNVKLIKSNDKTRYTPICIPYDFDYCGLINASYAVPPEMLPIESVTERVYRGFCRTDEEFQAAYDLFIQHKSEIVGLFENSELLDKRYKAEAVDYINDFYEIIENPKASKRAINDRCRTAQ